MHSWYVTGFVWSDVCAIILLSNREKNMLIQSYYKRVTIYIFFWSTSIFRKKKSIVKLQEGFCISRSGSLVDANRFGTNPTSFSPAREWKEHQENENWTAVFSYYEHWLFLLDKGKAYIILTSELGIFVWSWFWFNKTFYMWILIGYCIRQIATSRS